MPTRLHLREGDAAVVAEVTGADVTLVGAPGVLHVQPAADGCFVVKDGAALLTGAAVANGDVVWVAVDGWTFEVHAGRGARAAADADATMLSPPMPATVVRIGVTAGQKVARGDVLVALEAMKMELPIRATRDGTVRAVHCREGELVQPGTRLVEIE